MSPAKFVSVVRHLLGHTVAPPVRSSVKLPNNRFRPVLECCEDRTVPVVTLGVSVVTFTGAKEGTIDGVFRFTRTEDLSSALTANYSVGGTATSGTDYTALAGTVTFAANSAT